MNRLRQKNVQNDVVVVFQLWKDFLSSKIDIFKRFIRSEESKHFHVWLIDSG